MPGRPVGSDFVVHLPGEPVGPLSVAEKERLADDEAVIARGWRHFVEVGIALIDIRDALLYREQFNSFQDYIRVRWDMPVSRAYQQMRASTAMQFLETLDGVDVLPKNEMVARTLGTLISQGEQALVAEAWTLAISNAEGRPPTARQTEDAVREVRYRHSDYGQQEVLTGRRPGPMVLPDTLLRDTSTVVKSAIRNLRTAPLPDQKGLQHLDAAWRRRVRTDMVQLQRLVEDMIKAMDRADG